jgi:hypothetical protein
MKGVRHYPGFLAMAVGCLVILYAPLIVVTIYAVLLGLNIYLWAWWQKRGTSEASTEVVTSDFGRPLVRKG